MRTRPIKKIFAWTGLAVVTILENTVGLLPFIIDDIVVISKMRKGKYVNTEKTEWETFRSMLSDFRKLLFLAAVTFFVLYFCIDKSVFLVLGIIFTVVLVLLLLEALIYVFVGRSPFDSGAAYQRGTMND